jgi:hypothetical protein
MMKRNAVLIALAVAALGAGLYFGWSTLAALGLTTFIVSLLPCVAMCALGICAARMGKKDTVQPTDTPRKETS